MPESPIAEFPAAESAAAQSAAPPGLSVGVLAEARPGERRVALVPAMVERLVKAGSEVVVESGAGAGAWISDEAFTAAGARVGDPFAADIVACVNPPSEQQLASLSAGTVLVGLLAPLGDPERIERLDRAGVVAFALESVPRISRAQGMDALSSQAGVAGYRAVLLAAEWLPRFFPMLTTAAGTVGPARVLVLGAGVAGLQALATARRLGARTTGYDVRPEVADQVRSVGAQWLELGPEGGLDAAGAGGYARELSEQERAQQEQALTEAIAGFEVVITTALVPGRRAPVLVTEQAVAGMAPGSVVVDLAGEAGGNCALSQPGEVVTAQEASICAPLNLPAQMPVHASELYARNVVELVELITGPEGGVLLDGADEVIDGACVAGRGRLTAPAAAEDADRVSGDAEGSDGARAVNEPGAANEAGAASDAAGTAGGQR